MKEEIKEILNYIKKWSGISEIPMLVKLEDYITNLQEELEYSNYCNEQLRKKITNLEYKISLLQGEDTKESEVN